MDLEALRAFLAVVDTGSFVSAATSLRYARATLRRRVDELEAQAGVPLLHRTGQGATPTEAGAVLAERGRQVLREASALLSSVREIGAEPTGTVRIVLPVGMPPHLFAPMYQALRARHPKLRARVRFAEDPMARLLDDVDVAVSYAPPDADGPWISEVLMRIPERLVASRAYLAKHGAPTKDDLASRDLLVWEPPDGDSTMLPLLAGGELHVAPALASADVHLIRQCAAADLGIAFAPDGGIPEGGVELVPVLADVVGRERAVHVVTPSALSEVPRVKALLEQVHALMPK